MEGGDNKILYSIIIVLVIIIIVIYFTSKPSKEIYETKNDNRSSDFSKKLYISKSKIHGEGLFTNSDIENGKQITEVGDLDKWNRGVEFRTEFCKKVNHQINGNTRVEIVGNKLYLVSDRDIKGGEELTTNYKNLPDYFNRKTDNYIELN
jgi:hypothetical protein